MGFKFSRATAAALLLFGLGQGCSSDNGTSPQDPRFVGVVVKPDSMILNVGLQGHLEVWMVDTLGELVYPPSKVSYRSHNSSLAYVDAQGFVQAGNSSGTTTIKISTGGFSINHPVRVGRIPDMVTLSPTSIQLIPHGSRAILVSVRDQSGREIDPPPVTFTSSAPAIFSVGNNGIVTSVGPAGAGLVKIQTESYVEQVPVSVGGFPTVSLSHVTAAGHSMYQAAVGAGGTVVVTARDAGLATRGTLPGFDLPVSIGTGTMPLGLAVNQAGTRAYVATVGQLSVLDLSNNVALAPIPIPAGGDKLAVVLSHDETQAYVATAERLYVVDLGTNQVVGSVETGVVPFLALHPTLPRLYLSQSPIREVDLTTMQVTAREIGPPNAIPREIAVSPDGAELYVVDGGQDLMRIIDLITLRQIQTAQWPAHGNANGLAVSSKWIVTTSGPEVRVFDRATRFPVATVPVGGVASHPAISPDGTTIVVPNENGDVDFIQ